jgi:hypothetical protein
VFYAWDEKPTYGEGGERMIGRDYRKSTTFERETSVQTHLHFAAIPSSAGTSHFSALAFLASERCSLVIEALNPSERALYFSD